MLNDRKDSTSLPVTGKLVDSQQLLVVRRWSASGQLLPKLLRFKLLNFLSAIGVDP